MSPIRLLALASTLLLAAACSKPAEKAAQASDTLTVAATPVPHAEILEVVRPMLAKEGLKLQVKVFNDYVQPNLQVDQQQKLSKKKQHLM